MGKFLPLMFETVTPSLKSKAICELNENEDYVALEIKELRTMAQEHNVPCCQEDSFLLWFLRCKKHDQNRAFKQLKQYSYERHNWMNYYGFITYDRIRVPLEKGICGLLPLRDEEGRTVMFLRASQWNGRDCDCDDILRAMQAIIHFAMQFPASQISGFSFIMDSALASLDTLKLFIKYVRIVAPTIHIFPGRFQRILIVNANIMIRGLSPILLAVMPSKLRKRTSFLGDAKTALPEIYDRSILPEEFGGTLGPITKLHHLYLKDLKAYVPKLHASNKFYKRKNTLAYPEIYESSAKDDQDCIPQY